MKKIKELFHKYNQPDTLMVFSSYALKDGDISKQNALAWYTKELLSSLPKSQKIIVLAENVKGNSNKIIQKDNILIIPCWQKRNFCSILKNLYYYSVFNRAKNVLIQFEFNYFGHIFGPLIMLFTLAYLKILNKKVLFQLHEIVTNLYIIRKQINLTNKAALHFFNFSLNVFYKLINFFVDKILVTESSLAAKFKKITGSNKVMILPIMVKSQLQKVEKNEFNHLKNIYKLKNKFVILFFGYLSWYKGIDWLVDIFPHLKKKVPNLTLVVAGDASPTLVGDKHYDHWYANLKSKMKKEKDIIHTGFISNNDVELWLSTSDLLILPYKVFKSSSGPLSWALSYNKPVIFSIPLKEYKKSDDFAYALKKSDLTDSDIFFDLNAKSLANLIQNLKIGQLKKFTKNLAETRSEKTVSTKLLNIFNPANNKKINNNAKSLLLKALRLAIR